MKSKLLVLAAIALALSALSLAQSAAQQAVSVTVAATRSGVIAVGCPPRPPTVSTPAEFTLTRTGDVTGSLDVSVSWSGDLASGTTISPTSVTFAPGSATAIVSPVFGTIPQSSGDLILAVMSGPGYQPGRPPVAYMTFSIVIPSCAARNPPVVSPSPPVQVNPSLTG